MPTWTQFVNDLGGNNVGVSFYECTQRTCSLEETLVASLEGFWDGVNYPYDESTHLRNYFGRNSDFGIYHNALISENSSLTDELITLTSDYNSIIEERDELLSTQDQGGSAESSGAVFSYVNWPRANKSKAFYKDVKWKDIPFDDLSELEIGNIDWSKVNYKEAEQAESFDIDFIDSGGWAEINSAGKKQKKIYKDIDWEGVDYQNLSADTEEGIDWSHVDYKEAIRSETFNLDSVDIAELKANPKAFKKFLKATALKKASADSLLAEASSETLEGIGLKNYAGKISEKITKSFSTDSGEYKLVMKPSSFDRASAIAKGMGGTLADLETEQESDDFADGLTGVINEQPVARKLISVSAPHDFYVAWLGGSDVADLHQVQYEGQRTGQAIVDIVSTNEPWWGEEGSGNLWNVNGQELWYVVEMPEASPIVAPAERQAGDDCDPYDSYYDNPANGYCGEAVGHVPA